MAKDLSFSTGIVEYTLNGEPFRVNMTDDNLYHRFLQLENVIEGVKAEFMERTKGLDVKLDLTGFPKTDDDRIDVSALTEEQVDAVMGRTEALISTSYDIDQRVKQELAKVFGEDNDFDAIFQGANVMAFDADGNRIISNFFNAITPIIQEARKVTDSEVDKHVGNREQRRARNRGAHGTA